MDHKQRRELENYKVLRNSILSNIRSANSDLEKKYKELEEVNRRLEILNSECQEVARVVGDLLDKRVTIRTAIELKIELGREMIEKNKVDLEERIRMNEVEANLRLHEIKELGNSIQIFNKIKKSLLPVLREKESGLKDIVLAREQKDESVKKIQDIESKISESLTKNHKEQKVYETNIRFFKKQIVELKQISLDLDSEIEKKENKESNLTKREQNVDVLVRRIKKVYKKLYPNIDIENLIN